MTKRLPFLVFSGALLLFLLFVLLRIPGERPAAPPSDRSSSRVGDPVDAEPGPGDAASLSPSPSVASIRVVDAEGLPCRASVFAMGLAGRPPKRADYVGDTGKNGLLLSEDFKLPPRGLVFARAPGRVALPEPWGPRGIELTLGEGVVVTGTVSGEDGKPVAGALVTYGSGSSFREEYDRTATDREGRYRLTGTMPGSWGVAAETPGGSTSEAVTVENWSGEIRVDLQAGHLLGQPSALVEVTFSEPPEARPLLLVGEGGNASKLWLPCGDGLVRVPVSEKKTLLEAVCPGFRSVKTVLPSDSYDEEPAVTLKLVAGGGLPASILVVTPDGTPVPGALILLRRNESDHHPDAASAGSDGRYALHARLRGWLVTASASVGASEEVQILEGADEVRLVLGPGASVTGRIVDRATGEGIADTLVRLAGGDCHCCSPWSTPTDERGEYRFEGIPRGFFVQPWVAGGRGVMGNLSESIRSHAEAVARGRGHLAQGGETMRMSDIPVDRHPVFECRLRVEAGVPGERVVIEDARVEGGTSTHYRRLDDDPVLTFELDAGRRLFLVKSGDLRGTAWAEPGEEDPAVEVTVRLSHPPKVTAVLVGPVESKHLRSLRCSVGVEVMHRDGGAITRGGGESPDSEGRVDLSGAVLALDSPDIVNVFKFGQGPPRLFRLKDGLLEFTGAELAAKLRESPDGVVLELALEKRGPPKVTVLVVGLDGKPLAGVRIGDPDDDEVEAVTDAAGQAVISPHGKPLFPWLGDWRLPWERSTETLRLTVEPARRLRLQLVGEDGSPLAGVDAWIEDDDWAQTDVDEDGGIEMVVPARWTSLLFSGTGYWFPRVDLTKADAVIEVRPLPLRTVEVTVHGPEELSVEREIGVFWSAGPEGESATRSDELRRVGDAWRGEIEVPPFAVSLRAVTSNLRYMGRAELPAALGEVRLELSPCQMHKVTFLLRDPEGTPLANRRVSADERAYTAGVLLPPEARTDGAGRVELEMPEGSHRIRYFRVRGFRIEEFRFTSPAEDIIEVRLEKVD